MNTPAYNITVMVGQTRCARGFPKVPSTGEYFQMDNKYWRVESVILSTHSIEKCARVEFDVYDHAVIVAKEVGRDEAFHVEPQIGKWVRE